MIREYESASSLTRFLGCPYSYQLKYIDNVIPTYRDTQKNIIHGSAVHKSLDKFGKTKDLDSVPEPHKDYAMALSKYLDKHDDEIIETEKEIVVDLNGHKIFCIIDAITKKGKALEYKITKSPQWYENQLSYQLRIYTLALKKANIEATPVYLLFENAINKYDDNLYKLKKLHVHYPVATEIRVETFEREVDHFLKFMSTCYLESIFPPILNNCGKCDYKNDCENYSGY
jgi:hypothetical protein